MKQLYKPSVSLLSFLRWSIPLLIFLIGSGYILFDQVMYQGNAPASFHVFRTFLVLNLLGPALVWVVLVWAERTARSEAEAQQELAWRNRELAALNGIGQVASQFLDVDKILNTTLEQIVELFDLPAVEIRLIENGRLVLRAQSGFSKNLTETERDLDFNSCLCGICIQNGTPIIKDNLATETLNSVCRNEGFLSSISIPMKTQGHVIGVVHVASHQPNAFGVNKQEILKEISERVTIAIENAQLYQEARRKALHLETANLVGQRITSLMDPNTLLSEILQLVREKFGYAHAHVLLVDEAGHELVLKAASGPCAEAMLQKGLRLKIGQQGITGWVAHTGEPLLCNDVNQDSRFYAAEPDTKSELAVPLRVGDRIIGVLDVQNEKPNAFDREDATILQIMGNQIGAALENARLFQETRQRYEAMIALHETSLDMIAQLDMPQLLEALLGRGVQLLGARAGILFLNNPTRQTIDVAASYNAWKDWRGVTLKTGEGVAGHVIQTGKPIIVNDYANWPNKPPAFAGSPDGAVVSVPLTWRGQIIGTINVFNTDLHPRPFDDDALWLLGMFADLATIAIKNAELHTQVKDFSQNLERKVEQRTLELSKAKEEIVIKAEQLRVLLDKTINIQEEERGRIARDMHDGVVQLLTAVRYELRVAKLAIESGSLASALDEFDTTRELLDEIEGEIRRTIYNLKPPALDAIGLVPVLQNYVGRFQALANTLCDFQVRGIPYRLAPSAETSIFRMVEEALHNVRKHANAKTVSVTLDFQPSRLSITLEDDGVGFDYDHWLSSHNGTSLGLLGMHERTRSLGGTLELSSKCGQGTRVAFHLPVELDGGHTLGEKMPSG